MDYETFVTEVTGHFRNSFPGMTVKTETVEKPGGASYLGLVLKKPEDPAGLILNVDRYYPMAEEGLEEALKGMYRDLQVLEAEPLLPDPEVLRDYGSLKDCLVMQMVAVSGNEDILKKVPHKLFGDLAVLFRFDLGGTEERSLSTLIRSETLSAYGIEAGTLFTDAMEACMKNRPVSLKSMEEVLFGTEEPEAPGLYVLSNDTGRYGASVITYPGVPERIADLLGGGYFLLPSSTHEMIVIPEGLIPDVATLDRMVKEVNAREVLPEERLTDHCYHYAPEDKVLESGVSFAKRPHPVYRTGASFRVVG